MTDTNRAPMPLQAGPQNSNGQPDRHAPTPRQPEQAEAADIADAVVDRIGTKVSDKRAPQQADSVSVEQAIAAHDSLGYRAALEILEGGAVRDVRIVPGV